MAADVYGISLVVCTVSAAFLLGWLCWRLRP